MFYGFNLFSISLDRSMRQLDLNVGYISVKGFDGSLLSIEYNEVMGYFDFEICYFWAIIGLLSNRLSGR